MTTSRPFLMFQGGSAQAALDLYFATFPDSHMDFASEAELERAFGVLSEGGQVLMPLNNYGFSQRFGWLNDRFGVSWQFNPAASET